MADLATILFLAAVAFVVARLIYQGLPETRDRLDDVLREGECGDSDSRPYGVDGWPR